MPSVSKLQLGKANSIKEQTCERAGAALPWAWPWAVCWINSRNRGAGWELHAYKPRKNKSFTKIVGDTVFKICPVIHPQLLLPLWVQLLQLADCASDETRRLMADALYF